MSNNIKTAIKEEVVRAWDELNTFTVLYGADHELTNRQRTVWVTLDDLWNKLYPNEQY